jgi:hypothetical protein
VYLVDYYLPHGTNLLHSFMIGECLDWNHSLSSMLIRHCLMTACFLTFVFSSTPNDFQVQGSEMLFLIDFAFAKE